MGIYSLNELVIMCCPWSLLFLCCQKGEGFDAKANRHTVVDTSLMEILELYFYLSFVMEKLENRE